MTNILFCSKKTYQVIKEILDSEESFKRSYSFISIEDGITSPEEIRNKSLGNGNICIATYFPDKYRKIFTNNVVDLNVNSKDLRIAKEIRYCLSNFGKDYPMTNNTFFISDTHFYHSNIIKYCNRPFESIEDMNDTIVRNWNNTVGKDDIVWHLGDFCFGKKDNIVEIFPRLNGKINIVLGNHDNQKIGFYYDIGFHRVYDKPVIINNFVVLSHAPLEWVKEPMFNIFGHVHDNSIYSTWSKNGCCACVERHEYKPISWKEIQQQYNKMNLDI